MSDTSFRGRRSATLRGVNDSEFLAQLRRVVASLNPIIDEIVTTVGANPEIGFQEHESVRLIAGLLEERGHACEVGLAGMDTAFRAVHTSGDGPRVAVLAEYDALPDLGHACGHNIIAAVAVGTYLSLTQLSMGGTIEIIGCPAEESAVDGAGGKVRLVEAGIFDGFDAVFMVHPYDRYMVVTHGSLAARGVDLEFMGRTTHPVAHPELGLNALDAAISAYSAITRLRDQLPRDNFMNAIIPDGGYSANTVPDYARVRYRLRAPHSASVDELLDCVVDTARSIATAAGCTFKAKEYVPLYEELLQDPELVDMARDAMEALGYAFEPDETSISVSSTDFGNVSQVARALEIGVQVAPRGTGLHSRDFAAAATSGGATAAATAGTEILTLAMLTALDRLAVDAARTPRMDRS